MIDVLLNAEIDGEKLAFGDIVSNAMLLVQAGLETTASAMSFAFHYLATHPAERDRLIREPEIMPRAVEEFIRFAGSIHGIPRTVAKEVELAGHTFCPGESVIVNYASANRDAERVPRSRSLRPRSPGEPAPRLRGGRTSLPGLQPRARRVPHRSGTGPVANA